MKLLKNILLSLFLGNSYFLSAPVSAQAIDRANLKIIERLLGSRVDRSDPQIQSALEQMRQNPGNKAAVLRQITHNYDHFYKVMVKNFASRMSVRSEEVSIPLNDFSATVIGVVRDDIDARQLLTGNYIYIADTRRIPQSTPNITIRSNMFNDIIRSNNHYQDIDNNLYRINLSSILQQQVQQVLSNNDLNNPVLVNNPDPAGLLTSNTWGREHLIAGTNRRAVEYALRSFLCTPIENAADTQASDSHIGRDIDRFPGGDHTRFLTTCKGCHTVMDGFRGAFARWNFNNVANGFLVYGGLHPGRFGMNANGIANKMNQNANEFPGGYQTVNDSWVNYATRGKNANKFAWGSDNPQIGQGAGSFGQLLSSSQRFAQCMARRSIVEICQRSQNVFINLDHPAVSKLAQTFIQSNYNLRELFIATSLAEVCK